MVNTTLTDLSIGANGLGLIFAKSLSATLANNSTLQTMNIGASFFKLFAALVLYYLNYHVSPAAVWRGCQYARLSRLGLGFETRDWQASYNKYFLI